MPTSLTQFTITHTHTSEDPDALKAVNDALSGKVSVSNLSVQSRLIPIAGTPPAQPTGSGITQTVTKTTLPAGDPPAVLAARAANQAAAQTAQPAS